MGWNLISRAPMRLHCDSNDVLLIQQNHADWQLIIGFVTRRSAGRIYFAHDFPRKRKEHA
jgi:hypothetical protein